ncbi:MAG: EamA family transporter [Patescibacteria group bacterium]
MIVWVSLAALAQFITAFTILVDKYVLVSRFYAGKPIVYTFYVSILSSFVFVLVPFGLISWPTREVAGLSLHAAAAFLAGLYFLYAALKKGHASDAIPIIGATTAITASILAFFFLKEDLPLAFLPAFGFFVVGTFLISHFHLSLRELSLVILSGALFGASSVLLKIIFLQASFIDGFFWSRAALVVGALLLLLWPPNREAIFHSVRRSRSSTKWLIVGNKALAGVASVLTLFAISLGSVSVVNAMTGLQFAFLLMFAYLGAHWLPVVFKGEVHRHHFPHKLYGTICIMLGIIALFVVQ